MKKPLKNNKEVNDRNYYIVLVIAILTVAITLYIRSFIINYQNNIKNKSVFENNIQSIKINDLDYLIPETEEAIIYVSYTGNAEVTSMESKLYKRIKKRSLEEKVLYLDITDNLDANEYIVILKEKLPDIKDKINSSPLLIYIKDGKAVDAMSSELKMIDYKIFDKLVDEYDIDNRE